MASGSVVMGVRTKASYLRKQPLTEHSEGRKVFRLLKETTSRKRKRESGVRSGQKIHR